MDLKYCKKYFENKKIILYSIYFPIKNIFIKSIISLFKILEERRNYWNRTSNKEDSVYKIKLT